MHNVLLALIFLLLPNMTLASNVLRLSVAQDGSAQFQTIQAALDSLPATAEQAIIQIKPGIYQEKLYLTRDKVALVGQGPLRPSFNMLNCGQIGWRPIRMTGAAPW